MTSEQTRSNKVPRTMGTAGATSLATLSNTSSSQISSFSNPSPFRFTDLPEELQRHIITFCLPPFWSIRASRPIRLSRTSTSHPSDSDWTSTTSASNANPNYIYGLRQSPPTPRSLHLISKHTTSQVHSCAQKTFTGDLYLSSVLGEPGITTYYQYGLGTDPLSSPGEAGVTGKLDSYRALITTVHMGCYQYMSDSRGFELGLLGVLPNLRRVVAHSENRLHEESLYGWGSAESLIGMVSNEALVRCVQRREGVPSPPVPAWAWNPSPRESEPEEGVLPALWKAGLTTLHEMKVNMGAGEMMVSFYCVFWIREARDAEVLGKHSVREWEGNSRLRRKVYERAVMEVE